MIYPLLQANSVQARKAAFQTPMSVAKRASFVQTERRWSPGIANIITTTTHHNSRLMAQILLLRPLLLGIIRRQFQVVFVAENPSWVEMKMCKNPDLQYLSVVALHFAVNAPYPHRLHQTRAAQAPSRAAARKAASRILPQAQLMHG